MATFIEALGLLNIFSIIFPMILVFAIIFAFLQKTKLLGYDMAAINAIVAIVSAFMLLLFPSLAAVIQVMTPWFVILFVFLMLLLLLFRMVGQSEQSIMHFVQNDKSVNYVVIAVGALIILGSFAFVYGQQILPVTQQTGDVVDDGSTTATPDYLTNLYGTIFHPKVIGLAVLFTIAIFTIILLGAHPSAP